MEFFIVVVIILGLMYWFGGKCTNRVCDEPWYIHYTGQCHNDVCEVDDDCRDDCHEHETCCHVNDVLDGGDSVTLEGKTDIMVTLTWTSKSKERKWNGMTWKKGETKFLSSIPDGTQNGVETSKGLIVSW